MLDKLRARPVPLWRQVLGNVSARVIAIVGLTVATVMVARAGGASAVGSYALLRMLPGLFGGWPFSGFPGQWPTSSPPRARTVPACGRPSQRSPRQELWWER